MDITKYECIEHRLDIICICCVKAWIARHEKMKTLLLEMIEPLKDRDDYFEMWQERAKELLKEIGLLD